MIKICFVCLGNICRSPMAEFIFQSLIQKENLQEKIFCCSRATSSEELGNPIDSRAAQMLEKYKVPYSNRRATVLKSNDGEVFDYIIGMDTSNIFHIQQILNYNYEDKIFKLLDFLNSGEDIKDPWYHGNFEEVYQQIYAGCRELLTFLKTKYTL